MSHRAGCKHSGTLQSAHLQSQAGQSSLQALHVPEVLPAASYVTLQEALSLGQKGSHCSYLTEGTLRLRQVI